MNGSRIGLLLITVLALLSGSAGNPGDSPSDSFSFATYREIDGRVTLLVGSFLASLHTEDTYIPIPVAIGLRGNGPGLTVTPESFTLIDQAGRAHPAAGYEEVLRGYPKLSWDRTVLRSRPLAVGQQFDLSLRLSSRFYPATNHGLRIPRVSMAAYTWFSDVIYFPQPTHGLGGVLTLRLSGKGVDPPIDVRFTVPLKGRSA